MEELQGMEKGVHASWKISLVHKDIWVPSPDKKVVLTQGRGQSLVYKINLYGPMARVCDKVVLLYFVC